MTKSKASKWSVGDWTQDKIEILREYASAYSQIMAKQKEKIRFSHVYIDAFAGAGEYKSKQCQEGFGDQLDVFASAMEPKSKTVHELVAGSVKSILSVEPPFDEYYFIDTDPKNIDSLTRITGGT